MYCNSQKVYRRSLQLVSKLFVPCIKQEFTYTAVNLFSMSSRGMVIWKQIILLDNDLHILLFSILCYRSCCIAFLLHLEVKLSKLMKQTSYSEHTIINVSCDRHDPPAIPLQDCAPGHVYINISSTQNIMKIYMVASHLNKKNKEEKENGYKAPCC